MAEISMENLMKINKEYIVYEEVRNRLEEYLHGVEKPNEHEWREQVEKLLNECTIRIPGTAGGKFNKIKALEIINNAITQKSKLFSMPSVEAVKEPQFILNQEYGTDEYRGTK